MEQFLEFAAESLLNSAINILYVLATVVVLYIVYKIIKLRVSKKFEPDDGRGLTISNEQHWSELQDIKKKMNSGEPIKIDAVKALYIAQHWDEYNLVGSEDGKILYDRLKHATDVVDVGTEDAQKQISSEDDKVRVVHLEDGTIRRITKLGYVDFKDGLMTGSKTFEAEKKEQKKPTKQNKQAQIANVQENFEMDDEEETHVPSSEKKSEPASNEPDKNSFEYFQKLQEKKSKEEKANNIESKMQTNEIVHEEKKPEAPEIKNIHQEKDVTNQNQKKVQGDFSEAFNLNAAQEKFTTDEKIIDAKALANLVSKPQKPLEKKETLVFDPVYIFENVKLFFTQDFLCEPGDFKKKFANFISFLIKHNFVFLAEGDKRLLVHVDSFVMALARTIKKENRELFLKNIYDKEGALDNDAFCSIIQRLSNKLDLHFEKGFIFSSNLQNGNKAFMFSRGLKHANKVFLGEFVIFTLTNAMELLDGIDTTSINGAIVLATKSSEFESLKGKRLKIKSLEEILNVL